ncbi:MAG TPA: hypothetical protein VJZ27_06250, partial [Aggregatilineales bacterium]|nr:hypothetical protein [Aggregatilineales bacterium]
LWLNTDGKLILQPISGENAGRWIEAGLELVNDSPIVEVQPLPTGIGAVLRLQDGRAFYFDVFSNTVKAIEGL